MTTSNFTIGVSDVALLFTVCIDDRKNMKLYLDVTQNFVKKLESFRASFLPKALRFESSITFRETSTLKFIKISSEKIPAIVRKS